MSIDLRQLASDPAAFAETLTIPAATGNARFGDVMAPFQRETFADLAPALLAVANGEKPQHGRYWIERTKGGSKDADLAVGILWLLAFARRPVVCQVGAADEDQADEMRKRAKAILRLNPWLASRVELQRTRILCEATGSECEIIPADVAGSHGAIPDLLVLNELSHITRREFAENLFDNAAKVPHGLAVVATNAGFLSSWQWSWREIAQQSDRWRFHRLAEPAPWLDPADIEDAEQRNPASRFRRLWWGEWVSGDGDALAGDVIDRAVTLPAPPGPERGWSYCGGLDLAVKRDHAALAVVGRHMGYSEEKPRERRPLHPTIEAQIDLGLMPDPRGSETETVHHDGTYRLRLADCRAWKPNPQVDLQAVENAVYAAAQRFTLQSVYYDPHQAEHLAQRLRRRGVTMVPVHFSGQSLTTMASTMLEQFNSGNVDLYADDDLIADLRKLRVVEKSYGYRLESPRDRRGHGDRATAFALAMMGAKNLQSPFLTRPLLLAGDYLPESDFLGSSDEWRWGMPVGY